MKKLLFITLSIGFLNAQAQKLDSLTKNTHLFVKMGVTQNNLHQNDLFNQSLTGLEMGASLQTKLKPNVYAEIGLSYIRKGGAREVIYYNTVNEKILSYTENVYLHYVQLPVVLNYNHHFSGPTHLLLGAGAYGGYLFSAFTNPQHYYLSHEQEHQYNNWDMGGILSATICYKKWALYGQYQTGILNVSNNTGGLNNTWVFGLAYRLK
jgi:hypothetical protein